ncbi:hypothetical protein B0H14DRAFT_3747837 [Mycena olivaceomarginata]|nr:hypothetical protein B0H14DRAFT_3747837 [Mycena olivaceomarginata]
MRSKLLCAALATQTPTFGGWRCSGNALHKGAGEGQEKNTMQLRSDFLAHSCTINCLVRRDHTLLAGLTAPVLSERLFLQSAISLKLRMGAIPNGQTKRKADVQDGANKRRKTDSVQVLDGNITPPVPHDDFLHPYHILSAEEKLKIMQEYYDATSNRAIQRFECSFCGACQCFDDVDHIPCSDLDISLLETAVQELRLSSGLAGSRGMTLWMEMMGMSRPEQRQQLTATAGVSGVKAAKVRRVTRKVLLAAMDQRRVRMVSQKKKKPAKRFRETMTNMVSRVSNFMKIQKLRSKDETTKLLRSFFTDASTKLDTKTSVKKMRTENGLKDKFQMVFIDRLFESYKTKRGAETKRAALEAAVASLPRQHDESSLAKKRRAQHLNYVSLMIAVSAGLDPHQDTPVEILHVVLLGFVKYLWRDLIQQLKGKDEKKELLVTRLSSFNVSGLGISPLAGKTLVQYSGSLTGRDFRAIAQVAPFVLYDLVSRDCFETWQALSKIIPLIWQPEINDIESHLALLTKEIDHFLLSAGLTSQNSTFFLHLPAHIRRFGPVILFATEAFESFNAIIRAKSVHSNRHAPSRDIAHAFAQGNRIRHLLRGGLFVPSTPAGDVSVDTPQGQQPRPQPAESTFIRDKSAWRAIGDGPKNLVSGRSTVTHYLGLDKKREPAAGISLADKTAPRPINQTLTGQHIHSWSTKPGLFKTNKQLYLLNGDSCVPHTFVIVKHPRRPGETFVARVEELIQQVGSIADFASRPDGVLLQKTIIDHAREHYGMPSVQLAGEWSLHSTEHNCMDNHCAATASIPLFQERTKTAQTIARIAHTQNLHDLVLNTAQMRDAVLVQPYRLN